MTRPATEHLSTARRAVGVTEVTGLDLLTHRERDADRDAGRLAATLIEAGIGDLTIATHTAVLGERRHVALTVEAAGDPGVVWDILRERAAEAEASGTVTGVLQSGRFRGQPDLRLSLLSAVTAHRSGTSGRAVIYPGCRDLTGTLTVRDVLSRSAIDEVRVLAGRPPDHCVPVNTRDFVRPRWQRGLLVLDVQQAAKGVLVPFESPTPTPCCADHR
jgi:hypothetical protein